MFAGVTGCFAAGSELALLSASGAGGRTSFEGIEAGIAGCTIFAASCGDVGAGPEAVCGCVFPTGEIIEVAGTRGEVFVVRPLVSTFSTRGPGVLAVIRGGRFFAAFVGLRGRFGGISWYLLTMLSTSSKGMGLTVEVCAGVLLASGLGTPGVVAAGEGAIDFTA